MFTILFRASNGDESIYSGRAIHKSTEGLLTFMTENGRYSLQLEGPNGAAFIMNEEGKTVVKYKA